MLHAAFDGASSGNPGRAGLGAVIACGGRVMQEVSIAVDSATNNEAELLAFLEVVRSVAAFLRCRVEA